MEKIYKYFYMDMEREKSVFLWAKQHHLGVFDIMSSIDQLINNQTLVNAKQLFLCSNQPPSLPSLLNTN